MSITQLIIKYIFLKYSDIRDWLFVFCFVLQLLKRKIHDMTYHTVKKITIHAPTLSIISITFII